MKTSQHQFDLLVTYMEQHGDLSKLCTTARGKLTAIQRWDELTSLLNSDGSGDTKTTERWKKVWSDYKNNTKKKAARLHRAAGGTGGGPATHSKLSDLEQRVLQLIGRQAATGLTVHEAGFPQDIVAPSVSGLAPTPQPRAPSPLEVIVSSIHDSTEPEPSSQVQVHVDAHEEIRSAVVTPPCQVAEVIIESDDLVQVTPSRSSHQSHVAATSPQVQPARFGQTTPRRSERTSRIRTPPRRRTIRPTHTEQASEHFLHSDAEWRAFRMQQHTDYIQMRREQNRIREMEVQTQRDWQSLGIRILDSLDKLIDKFCRD